MAWLRNELGTGASDSRATAFAACAMRETGEETGLVLESRALLTPLRYIARAITPPGQVRRYDTRFFLAVVDRGQVRFEGTDGELSAIGWYRADTDHGERLHEVTATSFDTAAWLIYPSRAHLPLKTRAMIAFLRERAARGLHPEPMSRR